MILFQNEEFITIILQPQFGASAVFTNDLTDATRQQFGVGGYLAGGGGGGGGGTFVAKVS